MMRRYAYKIVDVCHIVVMITCIILKSGRKRALKIRTVDLMLVLDWKKFVKEFETIFAKESVCL